MERPSYFQNSFHWILFIYLFLAMLGLCCCTWPFSNGGKWGLLFVVVCRLLVEMASLVEHRLYRHTGFSSCGTQLPRGMWGLPGPGTRD